jgi:16S rRNA (guanine527-N7)-methyltransferase
MPAPPGATPGPAAAPEVASILFGDRLPVAIEYARYLAEVAVPRGLLGPREIPRLWERHLLNCAVVTVLCPDQAAVYDVGSGAGLPGIVWGIRRPDLVVTLLEPLLRRATFLTECVEALGLHNVTVVRARAEEVASAAAPADIVAARAVAPLDRLARWTLPLVRVGGDMIAIKGSSAGQEVDAARAVITSLGGSKITTVSCGVGLLQTPTVVLRVHKSRDAAPAGTTGSRLRRARRNR